MRARSFRDESTLTERNEFRFHLGKPCFALTLLFFLAAAGLRGQTAGEFLLSGDNAYNPIPSPNGKMIAYVRTGWGGPGGSGGFGRSNLLSEVAVITADGKPMTPTSLTDTFLEDWTPNGSALVCYRYWKYSLVALDGKQSSRGEFRAAEDFIPTERVAYLPLLGEIAWSRVGEPSSTVIETKNRIIASHDGWLGGTLLPSPDGRYIALISDTSQEHLWVYDLQLLRWSDLGPVTVHPDKDWDWMNATWNPWFSDSSHLAYISGSALVISEPDGNAKRTIPMGGHIGLATPSPDGKSVAYLSFDPVPKKESPQLQFWGGTIIWIVPLASGGEALAVTEKNSATTYDLRWLGNHALVFDRIADEVFPAHARIWKVAVRDDSRPKVGHTKQTHSTY